jgi:biopolymer transport protein ExbD
MNYSAFVCLLVSALATASAAQMQAPPMRQGVSVQMAKTANATPAPDADNEDAWVVSVTADGRLFFDVKTITPESLIEVMKATPRHRDQGLYVKADARASFGNVRRVLKVATVDGFESAVLLSKQNETTALGKLVAPQGLTVLLAVASAQPVVVQLRDSGQKLPKLLVDNREVMISDLQNAINQALQSRSERLIEMQADDSLPFATVALVIDASSSVKAKVVILPE